MRYRLHTLLILLAVLPPLIGGVWLGWIAAREYMANLERRVLLEHEGMVDESRRIQKGEPTFAP